MSIFETWIGLPFSVAPWPRAAGEEFVVVGIEDHAGDHRVALREPHRNAEARIVVREIRGAVERVDVPAKFGSGVAAGAFFGDDAMLRENIY